MAEVAPAGAKEVDQRPNTHDPFWDGQNDILKTYSFNYQALTEYKQKLHRSYCLGQHICFPPGYLCAALTYPCNTASSSTPSTRRLLDGTAMPVPRRSTEPEAPDALVDFHPGAT